MSDLLTREAILNAVDLASEEVEVEEWGGTVRIRAMNGTAASAFRDAVGKDKKGANLVASYLALSLVDEAGDRLFTDDQLEELAGKSAAVLTRLFDIASRLNGDDETAAEMVKNSAGGPSDSTSHPHVSPGMSTPPHVETRRSLLVACRSRRAGSPTRTPGALPPHRGTTPRSVSRPWPGV